MHMYATALHNIAPQYIPSHTDAHVVLRTDARGSTQQHTRAIGRALGSISRLSNLELSHARRQCHVSKQNPGSPNPSPRLSRQEYKQWQLRKPYNRAKPYNCAAADCGVICEVARLLT